MRKNLLASNMRNWSDLMNDVIFGLKSFIREDKQGNRASHVSIHVHNCSNKCTTDCLEHDHQQSQLHFQSPSFWRFFFPPSLSNRGGKLETDPTSSMLHHSIQSDGHERQLGRHCTGQWRDADHLDRDIPPIWQKECCAAWVFRCCNLNNSMLIAEARSVGFLGQGTGTRKP